MNVFEAVKQSVTTRQAAEYYGIHVGRNGMEEENLICMYHHDDRRRTMTAISGALPDMDADMRQLAGQIIQKLHNMTDAAFEEAKFNMTLSDAD